MSSQSYIFIFKILSFPLFFILIYIIVLIARLTISEGYFVFAPYADTKMSAEYSPEKFDIIKTGMKMTEVHNFIGKPLSEYYDSFTLSIKHRYTGDGKLLYKARSFWIPGDLAWYCSEIYYNKDSVVIQIVKDWRFD